MKRLAILLPWFSFFLREKYAQGFICLVLQISIVGWPLASFWAVITLMASGKSAKDSFVLHSLRPHFYEGQMENKRIA